MPVMPGMRIKTDSEVTKKARQANASVFMYISVYSGTSVLCKGTLK